MLVTIDLPEDLVKEILNNKELGGSFSQRVETLLTPKLSKYEGFLSIREGTTKIVELIRLFPVGASFNLSDLMDRFRLDDGARRQVGKEIHAMVGDLGIVKTDRARYGSVFQKISESAHGNPS